MEREVYLAPPKEIRVPGVIWKLKHCLYGLNDAARQFYRSVVECLTRLGCTQCTLDPALFFKLENGGLSGIIACHVDDFLHAGTEEFEQGVMDKLKERFLAGKVEGASFRYVGFDVRQDSEGITVDHSEYMKNIENGEIDPRRAVNKQEPLTGKEQTLLRQLVGRINWAVQGSQPDFAFEMIDLSTKLKQGTVGDLTRAIKCIERLKSGTSILRFSSLGRHENWRLVLYTDAALGNLEGSGSMCWSTRVLSNELEW